MPLSKEQRELKGATDKLFKALGLGGTGSDEDFLEAIKFNNDTLDKSMRTYEQGVEAGRKQVQDDIDACEKMNAKLRGDKPLELLLDAGFELGDRVKVILAEGNIVSVATEGSQLHVDIDIDTVDLINKNVDVLTCDVSQIIKD